MGERGKAKGTTLLLLHYPFLFLLLSHLLLLHLLVSLAALRKPVASKGTLIERYEIRMIPYNKKRGKRDESKKVNEKKRGERGERKRGRKKRRRWRRDLSLNSPAPPAASI